ncbi:MAG TPA: TIM barrel protein [Bryobacteraceae bacterium]|jgi:L-rhamnose isomerase/sugar isomerase|nr:TIM barrel protein [Bryobacteraceae bacterium]
MSDQKEQRVWKALDTFQIEIPSWGFANTGTRFGKFLQPGAATSVEDKFADAGEVHKLTGACPTVALHVLWDLPHGIESAAAIENYADHYGVRPGSINPNLFQDQEYKFGSLGNPDKAIRRRALAHLTDSVAIAKRLGSRDISLWFADGSNYPGSANIRHRKEWFTQGLRDMHAELTPGQRLLVEYKPFEPYFYHTDIADWGMSLLLSRAAGPQAKVLVDTGHHYAAQNIEQIVAWLLSENMLGGFHFNDRRYADDDLTIGSIDPYQVFRIFHEIAFFTWETGTTPDVAYMIDQSHNMKGKMEAMVQTVMTAQELYTKAALVDHRQLQKAQAAADIVSSEEYLKDAFSTDVRPIIEDWRRSKGLAPNPLQALRESGYVEKISRERAEKNAAAVSSYA